MEYVYNGQQVIEEYQGGMLMKSYVYGQYIDEVICQTDETSGTEYYYCVNQQNSTLALTDASGNIVERYEYTPYGKTTAYTDPGTDGLWFTTDDQLSTNNSSLITQVLFTGRRLDTESNLYYFRARMWNTSQGRFINRDPAGYVDGYNLYAGWFVGSMVDPWGLRTVIIYIYYNESIEKISDKIKAEVNRILQDCISSPSCCNKGNNVNLTWVTTKVNGDGSGDVEDLHLGEKADNIFNVNPDRIKTFLGQRNELPGNAYGYNTGWTSYYNPNKISKWAGPKDAAIAKGAIIAHEIFHHAIGGTYRDGDDPGYIDSDVTIIGSNLSPDACEELCDELDIQ